MKPTLVEEPLTQETQPVTITKIIEKTERQLRYNFTEKEIVEIARQLADKNREMAQLEEDKKRVTSDYKAKIDSRTSEISLLGNNITSGYEIRTTKCQVHFDVPKVGSKRIVRLDNGSEVAVEEMTAFEMQRQFDFEKEQAVQIKAKTDEEKDAAEYSATQ